MFLSEAWQWIHTDIANEAVGSNGHVENVCSVKANDWGDDEVAKYA